MNSNKKVLAWKRGDQYERVCLWDISEALQVFEERSLPRTFLGKVKFFRKFMESNGVDTRLIDLSFVKGGLSNGLSDLR